MIKERLKGKQKERKRGREDGYAFSLAKHGIQIIPVHHHPHHVENTTQFPLLPTHHPPHLVSTSLEIATSEVRFQVTDFTRVWAPSISQNTKSCSGEWEINGAKLPPDLCFHSKWRHLATRRYTIYGNSSKEKTGINDRALIMHFPSGILHHWRQENNGTIPVSGQIDKPHKAVQLHWLNTKQLGLTLAGR